MALILISAMTAQRVIGRGDGLPWNLPDEYEHFRRTVRGHPVILGRKSYEIFGPDLRDSPIVVVSRSVDRLPRAAVYPDVASALEAARALGERVFSAGGATIYRQTLPLADEMHLSLIRGDYPGDAFFPAFDESEWTIERTEEHPAWEFRVYRRRRG